MLKEGEEYMEVYLRPMTGRMVTVKCKPSDTVEYLKKQYFENKGSSRIPQDNEALRLIFNGVELEDSRTLSHCQIQNGSSMYSVFRYVCKCWFLPYMRYEWSEPKEDENIRDLKKEMAKSLSLIPKREEDRFQRSEWRRFRKEIMGCYKTPQPNFIRLETLGIEKEKKKKTFLLEIQGPKGSPYELGRFQFRIECDKSHPFKPPNITAITKIFHPLFIDENEGPCGKYGCNRGVLAGYEWSPEYFFKDLIYMLNLNLKGYKGFYLNEKPIFPRSKALELMEKGKFEDFERIGKLWTLKFACGKEFMEKDPDLRERVEYCGGLEIPRTTLKCLKSIDIYISKVFLLL